MNTSTLADLSQQTANRRIVLPLYFPAPVLVEEATAEGDLYLLRVRAQTGQIEEVTVEARQLSDALTAAPQGSATVVPAEDFYLSIKPARIRLAYADDLHFAVSLSGKETACPLTAA